MIISELIKLECGLEDIEKEFSNLGIDPIRWAIVKVQGGKFSVAVSFESDAQD